MKKNPRKTKQPRRFQQPPPQRSLSSSGGVFGQGGGNGPPADLNDATHPPFTTGPDAHLRAIYNDDQGTNPDEQ
jgi:hypothetical protein